MTDRWKSRTLWVTLILVAMTLIFLGVWIWVAWRMSALAFDLARDGQDVPAIFQTIVQVFPIGAMVTGLGAAATALIGGNKARDAARSLGARNANQNASDDHSR